jgi:TonB family protein
MKRNFAVVLLALGLAVACWSQEQKNGLPRECAKTIRVQGSVPKGPFKTLPNESYKQHPTIKYEILENGTVSNARITRQSGVADIDKQVLNSVSHWKYKPRRAGCGVIETEMSVTIDFY